VTAKGLFGTPSRLAAHTRYVLQDYLLMRAALPLALISFFAWLMSRSVIQSAGPKQWADPRFVAGIHSAYGSITGVLVYFTVFLAVIAVMTIDRTTGYYRFYFSKPVSVVSYAALTPLAFVFATSAQMTLADYTAPPRWLVLVAKVLPPELGFEKTRAMINNAQPFVGATLWQLLAYGAGGWILGLIFLRRRSLAR
jgi:hypothetical protein